MKNILMAVSLAGLLATPALAQFNLTRSAFGNGAAVSSNAEFKLAGTLSQPIIGPAANQSYRSLCGFWYRKPADVSTGISEEQPAGAPAVYALGQNYPNPFNPSTAIEFSLAQSGRVTLAVYNMLGQEVAKLLDLDMQAGSHRIVFEARNLPAGLYFYRLQSGEFSQVRRLTLLK